MSKIMLYQSLKHEMLKCEEDVRTDRVSVEATTIVFEAFLKKLCFEYEPSDVMSAHKQLSNDLRIIRTLKWLGCAGKVGPNSIWLIVKYFGTSRMMRVSTLADDLDELDQKLDENNKSNV
jgi:hypothetical protein